MGVDDRTETIDLDPKLLVLILKLKIGGKESLTKSLKSFEVIHRTLKNVRLGSSRILKFRKEVLQEENLAVDLLTSLALSIIMPLAPLLFAAFPLGTGTAGL